VPAISSDSEPPFSEVFVDRIGEPGRADINETAAVSYNHWVGRWADMSEEARFYKDPDHPFSNQARQFIQQFAQKLGMPVRDILR
jgi:hypothetical protein